MRWAARPTPYGHDTLAYGQSRPRAEPPPGGEEANRQLVELIPSQMAALRVFVGLADQLWCRRSAGWRSRSVRPRATTGSSGGGCI
nr:DUF6417 family protein [Streptomyces sp. S1D4-11]